MLRLNAVRENLNNRVRLLPSEMAQQLRDAKFAVFLLISSKGRSTMIKLKLLSMTALLSAAIKSPVLAQQAVQEPGAAALYQSLGVGSHNRPAANAFGLSVVTRPVKRHVRPLSR
jgi:hypothetical protein